MPDIDRWLANDKSRTQAAPGRAARAWNRVLDRPSTITVRRGLAGGTYVTLDAQTVRIDFDNYGTVMATDAGDVVVQTGVVYGVKDHPSASVDDTDLKPHDRFIYGGAEYIVTHIITPPGELQARITRKA